jgi:tetratricopeptide (TPR) repeat protein
MRATGVPALLLATYAATASAAEPTHDHPAPEQLGTVHFETSCAPKVQAEFDRAVALLHSFAYAASAQAFKSVADSDPRCAMAHWGVAMSVYHELWSPPSIADLRLGRDELQTARRIGARTDRERQLIEAAGTYFGDIEGTPHVTRAKDYERSMEVVAKHFPTDTEVQVFYALALISTAPPSDRSHTNQKRAAAILEPIYRDHPDHPGAAHYLIHAYDSAELAPRGLRVARAYSKIAPSAPHALHMPSHIFTRLGLWDDSIASNEAARVAAHNQGDIGEELHAMDYLTYAYLQRGRDSDAERLVGELRALRPLSGKDFTVAYAATAMPVRLAVERQRWQDAATVAALPDAAPHVAAITHWARALGHARSGQPELAGRDANAIEACEAQSRAGGDVYWATQTNVLGKEARAWIAVAVGHANEGVDLLRAAADAEDALEKLSVTPGPIVPAREQLGQLLLELQRPREALIELTQALKDAPGRRAALQAAVRAASEAGDAAAAARMRSLLGN